jgi:heparanase 1
MIKSLVIFTLVILSSKSSKADQVSVLGSQQRRAIKSKNRFVCVTLDYWPSDKYSPNPNAHYPWVNSSVFTADLTDPTLRAALSALAPLNLRVGGSLADQITYNVSAASSSTNEFCAPPLADASAVQGYTEGCLTGARYTSLHSLCADTGCGLLFGLNGLYGRTPAPSSEELWAGPWDPSNAEALLRFTKEAGLSSTLVGIELGNEIDGAAGISAKIAPVEYATSFTQLKTLLAEVWPDDDETDDLKQEHEIRRPMLIGPDSSGFSDSWWYPQFLGNLSLQSTELDAITWHLYFLGSGNSSDVPQEALNSTYLNQLAPKCQKHHATLETYARESGAVDDEVPAPMPQFWLGEGGGAYNSGQDGTTNTFLSTFWFADSLGTLAATGNDAFCRQALIGGNYALLQRTTSNSFTPNPDFYTALLWRTLMGDVVLSAFAQEEESDEGSSVTKSRWAVGGNGTQGDLRAYSHCARADNASALTTLPLLDLQAGSVTIVLINLSDRDRSVGLNVVVGSAPPLQGDNNPGYKGSSSSSSSSSSNQGPDKRYEWHLTSASLNSHETLLNGDLLELNESTGALPLPLQPAEVSFGSAVALAAHSTAFIVLPAAEAPACL